ncbi:SanA/YdcF family protein [Streptomonospora litoralis]|uniref:Vancomycin high temperature exclusion protein n=1 Tax=Streptomonospora litoralis TaxID=2498135 RepID=A0A4P6Q2W9_9ACTN|nr:ElyC/SanA/YdcF family protein [Streptomonospora litoralis]QBI52997.1 vancomycin high temperature exclusion protein [Streptomonospora litoralis]
MRPGTWAAAGVAATAVALAPTAWSYLASSGRRPGAGRVPIRPVAIVLGAAAWPSGPSPLLAARLEAAARLFHEGTIRALLISGDNRPESNRETDTMAAGLVGLGVPESSLVADPHGYRTWDTAVRARETFGVDRAIVVTQHFHLPRAVSLCRAAGVDAHGVSAPGFRRRPRSTVVGYLREMGANPRAVSDAVLQPAPGVVEPPRGDLRAVLSST